MLHNLVMKSLILLGSLSFTTLVYAHCCPGGCCPGMEVDNNFIWSSLKLNNMSNLNLTKLIRHDKHVKEMILKSDKYKLKSH